MAPSMTGLRNRSVLELGGVRGFELHGILLPLNIVRDSSYCSVVNVFMYPLYTVRNIDVFYARRLPLLMPGQ